MKHFESNQTTALQGEEDLGDNEVFLEPMDSDQDVFGIEPEDFTIESSEPEDNSLYEEKEEYLGRMYNMYMYGHVQNGKLHCSVCGRGYCGGSQYCGGGGCKMQGVIDGIKEKYGV